ncbi:amino acid permease [Arsenicicoccus dermatophilus]|uniref:amino acid permease n=1 Tax=Arsenicicoccus dermatophilus TaxID=1076331 RepID=UPI0039173155
MAQVTSGATRWTRPPSTPPGQGVSGSGLGQGLERRHLDLIALGGVIGAGLFVGSGVVIQHAGPAAIVSFLVAGVITVLMMRMLAEMAVSRPVVGSFYVYAREALGARGGFVVGWLYWYFFVIVVAVEAVAGARILAGWWPQVPVWAFGLGLLVTLTATNLVSARSYGEFEYWFSSIKVVAIVLFLAAGLLWITGLWPRSTPGLSGLWSHGGFAPHGWVAVVTAVVPCVAFYTGAEIVTIAAAESQDPRGAVEKAMRTIVLRVVTFYVGSVLVVVAVRAWDDPEIAVSPYAAALRTLGIPGVSTLMNLLILTAVLSCLNSALFTASRMLYALTGFGDAPPWFARVSRSGVPRRAIVAGTLVGWISVLAAVVSPDVVFAFLINSYGAVILFVYVAIAVSQIVLRRRGQAAGEPRPAVPMWGFPWLSYVTLALLVLVVVAMGLLPQTRPQLLVSLLTLAVVLGLFELRVRRGPDPASNPAPTREHA